MPEITLQLTITANPGAPRVPLTVDTGANCSDLRVRVSETTGIPLAQLKLIVRGRLITDDASKNAITEFKLEDQNVLHCMGKPAASSMPAPAAGTTATANDPGSTPTSVPTPSAPAAVANTSTASSNTPGTTSTPTSLEAALQRLRQLNSLDVFKTAVTTLSKILKNIIDNPMEEKYRKVKKNNAAFNRRLGGLPGGGDAIMLAAGFTLETGDEPVYLLQASAEAWPSLLAAQTTVNQAVQQAETAAASQAAPPIPAASMPGMPAGMPGMGMGMPPPGGLNNPQMQAMANQVLSDPQALQSMLQNPMVQQMMQNDPRIPPEMRQMMSQVASNPQMAQQIAQMMSNPAMRAQMEQTMQGAAGGSMPNFMPPGTNAGTNNNTAGSFPNFMPAAAQNIANDNNTTNNPSNPPARSDNEMTEDEMIAEAIRRSLQDNNNN